MSLVFSRPGLEEISRKDGREMEEFVYSKRV